MKSATKNLWVVRENVITPPLCFFTTFWWVFIGFCSGELFASGVALVASAVCILVVSAKVTLAKCPRKSEKRCFSSDPTTQQHRP